MKVNKVVCSQPHIGVISGANVWKVVLMGNTPDIPKNAAYFSA